MFLYFYLTFGLSSDSGRSRGFGGLDSFGWQEAAGEGIPPRRKLWMIFENERNIFAPAGMNRNVILRTAIKQDTDFRKLPSAFPFPPAFDFRLSAPDEKRQALSDLPLIASTEGFQFRKICTPQTRQWCNWFCCIRFQGLCQQPWRFRIHRSCPWRQR